jgi:3-oxoacyl-[acyl-carrier protein] reductase
MQSTRELEGRVALVTGAARNIGRAMALEFARAGAAVVVNARHSEAEANAVAAEIVAAGGQAKVVLANVADPDGAEALVAAAVEHFGRLDIRDNSAAIRRETPFSALGFAEWREVVSTILDGAFLTSHAALAHLRKSDQAAIVNLGGMSAHTGAAGRAHVVAAKAGVAGFTRALAHDLAGDGITVNCVSPGIIDTVRAGAEPGHHAGKMPLVGRRGTPQEVAALVRYLSGPEARYITGQTIHVNGGVFMA